MHYLLGNDSKNPEKRVIFAGKQTYTIMISCLQVENLTKSFGDLLLFESLSIGIGEGQRVGLIAKNGAGKTTLLNIMAGREQADSGEVVFRRDLRISYLEQDPHFSPDLTVLEACFSCDVPAAIAIAAYEKALTENDSNRIAECMIEVDRLGAWDYESRAKQILSQLKITDFDQHMGELSGGQTKRVALAHALIGEPNLLILDEPTNHLDMEMTRWLEEYLRQSNLTLLMVTHDRYFLDRVCSDIYEMDDRQIYTYKGNYSLYLEKRAQRLESAASQRESDLNLFRKELDWMRRQPQARATKAKSRMDAFYDLEDRLARPREGGSVTMDVKATYIGKKIFEAQKICKKYGDMVILRDFSYLFARYEKMGIVGDNGTGKSTFLKILMGLTEPDSGQIDLGETVKFGYYSQQGLEFDPTKQVIDVVTDIAEQVELGDGRSMSASQFLNYFLFSPQTQHNLVGKLSGGERRRLYLCTILMRSPNFLVLDEPTNDLDIMTLQVLEEYLRAFSGCLIVVSHDRYFMDKVADHLLVFQGGGQIKDFAGSYSDYLGWKEQQEVVKRAETVREAPARASTRTASTDSTDKRKLTFKERCELELLEKEIPELEREKFALEGEMSSGTMSMERLHEASLRISALIALLDEKGMRWLELSE